MKMLKQIVLSAALCLIAISAEAQSKYPFQNPELTIDERVADLVSRMTLEEKASQMQNISVAIERLGIPAYDWWNECLHGVGRSGDKVTVFPQAIGMAATFDSEALQMMGEITSDEARAIHHQALRDGKFGVQYKGLTFWTPNINIFRDPRWGRGQETYGEDPYLTGLLGSAIVRGLQGDDPKYLKTSACAKHYAVHSGPETGRHEFDVTVDPYELRDTYLPAFRELVVEAGVTSVMCAYNRYEGQPCCGNDQLMMFILRDLWNFDGYVTSDCGAIDDFYKFHKTHPDESAASADAVIHGTDLDCGQVYKALVDAVKKGLITEKQIDVSVQRLFGIRFKLGMFDPAENIKYAQIPYSVLECDKHKKHALKMARESIVMLKNENNFLPLKKNLKKIVVVGPNGDDKDVQLGNYNGFPSEIVTPFEGIKRKSSAEVVFLRGTNYTTGTEQDMAQVEQAVKGADVVIYVGGISPRLEGEEGDAGREKLDGFHGGDRTSIALPEIQTQMMSRIKKTGVPLVFVSMSGSALGFEWEAANANAVLQAWYGGQSAGEALADILFGDYSPSGRLPVTFYKNDKDLPDFLDYSMNNRTYRYFKGEPLYPFGYGLSYTTFEYDGFKIPSKMNTKGQITASVRVKNTGNVDADEVVQLYVSYENSDLRRPIRSLRGVKRINLKKGESKQVSFDLSAKDFALVDENGTINCAPATVRVYVGGGQPTSSTDMKNHSALLKITGDKVELPN